MSENGKGAGGNTLMGLGHSGTQVPKVTPSTAPSSLPNSDGPAMTLPMMSAQRVEQEVEAAAHAIGGRYFIEKEIGKGGMARVFSARHTNLDRTFALKQIHSDLSGDAQLRRQFLREARLASSLSHPNIVSVVDFGEDSQMGAYMVMELLDGAPLSDRLKRKNLMSIRMACDLVAQIADALHYIHGKGIVHCDVKPENILVCKMPTKQRSKWSIKLLDFGLAHSQSSSQSIRGAISGTPSYMAPETVSGHPPTPSSDIYSLGIVLYQMITGTVPFEGHFTDIMRAHVNTKPRPPSEICDREIDERLEKLILKALEKDPNDRQADMGAFIFELQTLMDMLGFGRKGRRVIKSDTGAHVVSIAEMAFEGAPLAMAAMNVNGTIEALNLEFRRFLNPVPPHSVPSQLRFEESVLAAVFPSLLADLKQSVHRDVCHVLRAEQSQEKGGARNVSVTLSPMRAKSDCVLISLSQSNS